MIIAMSGKMGSGKDTGVEYLIKNYGFKRMAFADDLKYMCMNSFGLTYEQCFDEAAKFTPFEEETPFLFFWHKHSPKAITLNINHLRNIGSWIEKNGFYLSSSQRFRLAALAEKNITFETPRHILQYVGTEICRDIVDVNYHAIVLKRNIDKCAEIRIAIADCRFPNERTAIKEWGGTTILVNERETLMAADQKAKAHASENSLGDASEYDYVIANSGTLFDLAYNINKIMGTKFGLTPDYLKQTTEVG